VSPRIFRDSSSPSISASRPSSRSHGIDIVLVDTDGDVWT